MSSYLDQTPGFVFIVGIGYLQKSYDEHALKKIGFPMCGEGEVPRQ